jgi:hypothetical protein
MDKDRAWKWEKFFGGVILFGVLFPALIGMFLVCVASVFMESGWPERLFAAWMAVLLAACFGGLVARLIREREEDRGG